MEVRKNKNRGYQKLRVWNDAIEYYVKTCQCFRKFRYDLRRIAAQAVVSADSVTEILPRATAGARLMNI